MVKKWIHWIPSITEKFKLNSDDSMIEDKSI